MLLTELSPKWLSPNLFVFLCPCCKKFWLSCKNIQLLNSEQRQLFLSEFGFDNTHWVVPSNPDVIWTFTGDSFANLTVTPSIDASASGNWYGFITNGKIT